MINKLLGRFGYILFNKKFLNKRYFHISHSNIYEHLILKHLHSDFFFVQIGANDGIRNDPIFSIVTKFNLSGIVMEPVPDIYQKLKKNYIDYPNVKPLNLAIHKSLKETLIYQVDPAIEKYGEKTKGTPSFFKEHHKLTGVDERDIIEIPVKCLTLDELINKNGLKNIDLLQIDTEGYDYEVIKMIDFTNIKPKIISFEHGVRMGIMSYAQLAELEKLLFDQGYKILVDEHDVRAYL